MNETKTCSDCGKNKRLHNFSLDASRNDGHDHICKYCRNHRRNRGNPRKKGECAIQYGEPLKVARYLGRASNNFDVIRVVI